MYRIPKNPGWQRIDQKYEENKAIIRSMGVDLRKWTKSRAKRDTRNPPSTETHSY